MKAIRQIKSGPPEVLELVEVRKPIPADDEVLIRVHAATVTRGDVILRKLHPLLYLPMSLFGVKRKEIPGHEFAGVVEVTGKGVKKFKPGDQVFGTTTGLKVDAVFKIKRKCLDFSDNLDQKAFQISIFHKQDEVIFS